MLSDKKFVVMFSWSIGKGLLVAQNQVEVKFELNSGSLIISFEVTLPRATAFMVQEMNTQIKTK